ncbi:MAG: hypothetical protein M1837_006290 [Sclerophora amabilis]|nr:MAG: hypothetical protein M1837_006290 [Sclerophora amabilis]
MASSITSRLHYLNDGAHMLFSTSPQISSQLLSQFNKVTFDNELKLPESRQRQVCGACGNIMLPGRSSHIYPDRPVRKSSGRNRRCKKQPRQSKKFIVFDCDRCHRKTRQVLQSGPQSSLSTAKASRVPTASASANEDQTGHVIQKGQGQPSPAMANASSKKRAKARKQGDLKTLLAKKKDENKETDSSHGFGLDLMDFLRKT